MSSEHLDPVHVRIAELREALESIIAEQRYLKAREARHRYSKCLLLCIIKIFVDWCVLIFVIN